MVKIVTDSTADLPPDVARDLDVAVAPLSIHFGDKTYIDGVDIDADTFYRLLQSEPVHPRTAAPPAGRFEEIFRSLAGGGEEVLCLTLAASLSGTYNSAALAARELPEGGVHVLDSGTISMAMGCMVIRAAQLAREGTARAEIEEAVRAMMPRVHIYLMADTLTYLQRGGRIGRARSMVGTMLNIKPIITLRDGEVAPLARVRTRTKALQEMADTIWKLGQSEELYVMHTAAPELAQQFAGMIHETTRARDIPILSLGPVVGVHLGPGSVGAIVLRQQ